MALPRADIRREGNFVTSFAVDATSEHWRQRLYALLALSKLNGHAEWGLPVTIFNVFCVLSKYLNEALKKQNKNKQDQTTTKTSIVKPLNIKL